MEEKEALDIVQNLAEEIQKNITDNIENPKLLALYANVLMNMGKEIFLQLNGANQTLKVIDYYRDLVVQERNNTTIH